MVALIPGTPLFEDIIAGAKIPVKMTSGFPTYAFLQNAFTDPSIREVFMNRDRQQANQVADLQNGMRFLMEGLSVYQPGRLAGIPSIMLAGLKDVLKGADVPADLTSDEVLNKWLNASSPREVVGALLGTALAALGVAVPVVGTIAAAVVGLATAIFSTLSALEKARDEGEARQQALRYAYLPPLQINDSDLDAELVNQVLRPLMNTGDWTTMYLPRYSGSWQAELRQGGCAFGPGSNGHIDPAEGAPLGCVPGTDTITGIVQINLPTDPKDRDTLAKSFFNFLRSGTGDPRAIDANGIEGKSRVVDLGTFLPCSGRLAGQLWNWSQQPHNPLKYRIDTTRLVAWRDYCEGGLQYIREVCYPWAKLHLINEDKYLGDQKEFYAYDPNADFAGYMGTGIFRAIGCFTCTRSGDLRNPPKYLPGKPPFGVPGADLGVPRGYGRINTEVFSGYSGPFLPILDASRWPDQCMGTRWDRGPLPIATAIAQMRAAQNWDLKHSPQSVATCRMLDAAFLADPLGLGDQLLRSRAALLLHEARFELDLDDIAEDEPSVPGIPGASWRNQLEAAGVRKTQPFLSKKARAVRFGGSGPVPPPPPAGGGGLVLAGGAVGAALLMAAVFATGGRRRAA